MSQQTLFDTHPLADLWGDPAPARLERRPAPVVASRAPVMLESHCLKCSKPLAAGVMFCNATCKARWQAGMNRWYNSLDRSIKPGQGDLFE